MLWSEQVLATTTYLLQSKHLPMRRRTVLPKVTAFTAIYHTVLMFVQLPGGEQKINKYPYRALHQQHRIYFSNFFYNTQRSILQSSTITNDNAKNTTTFPKKVYLRAFHLPSIWH
jgi:DNA repair protein RadC